MTTETKTNLPEMNVAQYFAFRMGRPLRREMDAHEFPLDSACGSDCRAPWRGKLERKATTARG